MARSVSVYGAQTGPHPNRRNFLSAAVVLAAACALAYPADVAAESVLEYAVLDQREGTLYLNFSAPPPYGNLTLRPDGADSFRTYDIHAERRDVLVLDQAELEQFRDITCPTIHVGAYGASVANHSVPLWVVPSGGWTPPRLGVDVSCTLTYGIVESPLVPDGDLLNAVHDGLKAWSELNPGLELRHVETGTANIRIEFDELHPPGTAGEACTDCLYTFATEWVVQGCMGMMGAPNQGAVIRLNASISEYDVLRDTVAQEFGHNLGLCHSCSADTVMGVGATDHQIPYEDLGYDIPKPVSDGTNAVDGFCGVAEMFGYLQETPEIYSPMGVVSMAVIAMAAGIMAAGIAAAVWRRARRTGAARRQRQPQQ